MAKKFYVFSTLTCAQLYTGYSKGGADLPVKEWEVHIQGGSNVAGKHLVTPLGVVTPITEEQKELLETNVVFQAHVKNGFVQVRDTNVDPEVAAADLETRDESAPLVEADFQGTDAKPAGSEEVATQTSAGRSRRA